MIAIALIFLVTSEGVRTLLVGLTQLPTMPQIQRLAEVVSPSSAIKRPVTFIDIDEETWEKWGRPPLTPRHRIAELVDKLGAAPPLVLLIDVDLSREEAGNVALRLSLERFATDHPAVPVLLPREIAMPSPGRSARRVTDFDDLPGVKWISVRFATDENRIVSHWRPFEIVCDPKAEALLSPQLFMTAFTEGGGRLAAIEAGLAETARRRCAGEPEADIRGLPSPERSPVPFAFGDVRGPIAALRPIRLGPTGEERSVPALFRLSASKVADQRLSTALVRGRIAIIGASHSDSGDVHLTPFGMMPGSMILANAMTVGMPASYADPPGTAQRLAWSAATAGLAVFLFRRFQELPFAVLGFGLVLSAYGLGVRIHGPSFATTVVTNSLSIFAASIAGLSLASICSRWRSGMGWKALLKERKR